MEKLVVIRTLAEMQALQKELADKQFIAFDTETDGVDKSSRIIGFSVAHDMDVGYYVILAEWKPETRITKHQIPDVDDDGKPTGTFSVYNEETLTGQLVFLETLKGAPAFMQSLVDKDLIMHNAPFDCSMVDNNFKVSLIESVHTDTMILGHVLNENRKNGLKELGVSLFGEDARKEQIEMKESVHKNGGMLTKKNYELFKADSDLIAKYGAKDAILTLKIFYAMVPELYEQKLDQFFYEDESMPLLRGSTYHLNTAGLRVDPEKLQLLKSTLETECMEAKAFIYKEIAPHIKDKYPGTSKVKTFNIGAPQQRAWLLYEVLGNEFHTLNNTGRELCHALDIKLPYSYSAKREFIEKCVELYGHEYGPPVLNEDTGKWSRSKKVGEPWKYMSSGKESMKKLASKYKWVERLLEYNKNLKLLNTYVEGIQSRMQYNVIRPSFFQHGTTSGRYSSKNPNFQNLPRDDKRVKACIVSRPGRVFVGADYSQLEPRVFASFSQDKRLMDCFKSGEDFYSVIGMEVFEKYDCVPLKEGPNAFGTKYKDLRNIAKVVALSSTYGTTAPKMAPTVGKSIQEAQDVIDSYFDKFPSVRKLMLESHEQAKKYGRVENLFGRPRRMPEALEIPKTFGKTPHEELPYVFRNMLNLAINHRIQSTGASIMNRAAIAFERACKAIGAEDPRWLEVKLVLQVHDELVAECPADIAEDVAIVLKDAMENTTHIPGVLLEAHPVIANNLADLK